MSAPTVALGRARESRVSRERAGRGDDATRRRLRLLTFSSLYPNVAEPRHGLFVRARTRALAGLADIQVMAPVPWTPPVPGLPSRYYRCALVPQTEEHDGLIVHHPRFAAIPKILKSTDPGLMALACARWVRTLRERFTFDAIDAHWACPDGVAAAILASVVGVPFSVTVRGDDINMFAEEPGRRRVIRWALRRAGCVIALSSELAGKVIALGVSPDRVIVIPNGVDTTLFRPLGREDARRTLGISAQSRIVFTAGRLHTSKGFPILVEALAMLGDAYRDVRLVIAGDPDGEADATPAIHAATQRFGLGGRVTLAGSLSPEDLVRWYGAADLFCLATSREGSANVLLEALACGLPCVTTDVGGNSDAVSSDERGILTTGDPAGMADGLSRALSRSWDRRALARSAGKRDWHAVAMECHQALQLLTAAGKATH